MKSSHTMQPSLHIYEGPKALCVPINIFCLHLEYKNKASSDLWVLLKEIEEIIARPEVDPVESGEAQRRRRTQDFDPPSTSHYATMRRRLVDSISNSAEPSGREDEDLPPDEADGILRGSIKFAELVDVMYFWALGEAYLQHPQMQSDMRCSLLFLYPFCPPLIYRLTDCEHASNLNCPAEAQSSRKAGQHWLASVPSWKFGHKCMVPLQKLCSLYPLISPSQLC